MGWRGKVVSGGQTGVDRAALDAAREAGLPIGGVVPLGRLAEDGTVPARYPLEECASADYAVRTEANVLRSDATLILNRGELAGGTLFTQAMCRKHRKPMLLVQLEREGRDAAIRVIAAFLKDQQPATLHIAGPRESKAPGIHAETLAILRSVFGVTAPG